MRDLANLAKTSFLCSLSTEMDNDAGTGAVGLCSSRFCRGFALGDGLSV